VEELLNWPLGQVKTHSCDVVSKEYDPVHDRHCDGDGPEHERHVGSQPRHCGLEVIYEGKSSGGHERTQTLTVDK